MNGIKFVIEAMFRISMVWETKPNSIVINLSDSDIVLKDDDIMG